MLHLLDFRKAFRSDLCNMLLREFDRGKSNCRRFQVRLQPVCVQEVTNACYFGLCSGSQVQVGCNAGIDCIAVAVKGRELQLFRNHMCLAGSGRARVLDGVFEQK
ncbi:hypothetical protein D3C73_367530 [compost metagenome]